MRPICTLALCVLALTIFPDIAEAKGRIRGAALPRDFNHPFYSGVLLLIACGGLLRLKGYIARRRMPSVAKTMLGRTVFATFMIVLIGGGLYTVNNAQTYEPSQRRTASTGTFGGLSGGSAFQSSTRISLSSLVSRETAQSSDDAEAAPVKPGARFVSARTNDADD